MQSVCWLVTLGSYAAAGASPDHTLLLGLSVRSGSRDLCWLETLGGYAAAGTPPDVVSTMQSSGHICGLSGVLTLGVQVKGIQRNSTAYSR